MLAGLFACMLGALTALPLISLFGIASGIDIEIWSHLATYVFPTALLQTALLLAGVAIIAGIAGAGTAWLVTTYQFPLRDWLIWLLPLPLAIPTYIAAYVYVDILDAAGPVQTALRDYFGWRTGADYWFPSIRSLGGAVLIFGFVQYPYVYLAARAMFQTQSAAFTESARIIGARPWRLIWDIALPLSRPALAVGIALALLETLNDIGASEYLGVQTMALSVFTTWLNRGSLAGAAQIAIAMLFLATALIALERFARAQRRYDIPALDTRVSQRIILRGGSQWLVTLICFVPFSLGFLLPTIFLVREAVARGMLDGIDAELFEHTLTSIRLAASATVIILVLGTAAAIILRTTRSRLVMSCVTMASLGYAIPGTVLALGLLSPFIAMDEAMNFVFVATSGAAVGLVVTGSSAAVVIAYVIRFLAIAIGFAQSGMSRISLDLDDAARSMGAGPAELARNLYLPLTRPAMWGAALLIFVDCMKELPATLLLRPLNTETLSTYIYQFATRGSFEDGAIAALLIVAVGIWPVIWLVRFSERSVAGQAL